MKSSTTRLDTSGELHLQRFRNGIKLVDPQSSTGRTVSDIFGLPLHFYFLNGYSEIQNITESCALIFGWDSAENAMGTTAQKVANRQSAELLFHHDRMVMSNNKMHIHEEPYRRLDGFDFVSTALKFSWYNTDDEVVGVFGCSILPEDENPHSVTESLTLLTDLGLLGHNDSNSQITVDKKYGLSLRQSECLHYFVRGMTFKQIGIALNLSPRTIEHCVEAIKRKMHCEKRSEIIEKYMAQNL